MDNVEQVDVVRVLVKRWPELKMVGSGHGAQERCDDGDVVVLLDEGHDGGTLARGWTPTHVAWRRIRGSCFRPVRAFSTSHVVVLGALLR